MIKVENYFDKEVKFNHVEEERKMMSTQIAFKTPSPLLEATITGFFQNWN